MRRYLARRVGAALVVLALTLTLAFFAVELAPGDPTNAFLHPKMSADQQEALRQTFGLDRPLLERYRAWVTAVVVRRDLGTSFLHNRPVTAVLADHLGPTLLLASTALAIEFAVGIALGIAAARRRGGWIDHLIRTLSLVLYSTPHFWMALMVLLVFSYQTGWFPGGHMTSAATAGGEADWLDVLYHLALPAATLGLASAGGVARYVRNSLSEILTEPFIQSARARGLSEARLARRHGLRNALGPLLELAGLSLPFLLSGALVTEVVFSWPGMGRLTYDAIQGRDYPLILGATALSAVLVVLGTLLADLGQAAADPRARHQWEIHEHGLV